MHAAADAAVALARKHLPALSGPALVAVGNAAIVTVALPGRSAVQDARAEAVAAGVPADVLDDCMTAGLEAARAYTLVAGEALHPPPAGVRDYNTARARYDPDIPVDFLPTLNFLDWLSTNERAQFACANAGTAGRPITEMKLGLLLGDFVKRERMRKRQGGGRFEVRGWSVAELKRVWAEEERPVEVP